MQYRRIGLAATLFFAALALRAESPGQRELAAGREALARSEHAAAAEHFRAATAALDPVGEKEALAEAWLQLGIAELTGLDRAEDALAAFEKSAELAANPSSAWLWASTAAEKLGRSDEAAELKARALKPPSPPPPAVEPTPTAPAKADAFQHFFGAKDSKTPAKTPPAPEAPAASPPPPSAPQAEPPPEKAVFQTLFGENRPDRPEGARQAQAEGEQGREKQAETKQEAARKAAPAKKGDAFRHFFGETKKDETKDGPEAPPS